MKPTSNNKDTVYFSLEPCMSNMGGHDPDKYWVHFQQYAIHDFSPNSIIEDLSMGHAVFVEKANALFNKHNIKVPAGYPANVHINSALYKSMGRQVVFYPWNEFTLCVYCCIIIEEQYGKDVSKIIQKELMEPNSRSGILHASSMASIALFYLKNGSSVVIPYEQDYQKNPDLVIDNFDCEVKVIDESDWTANIDQCTGKGKQRSLSEDICYDVGQFISKKDSGHKGIRQSDVIFANLSLKSFGLIESMLGTKNDIFPDLRKCRIIYFAKRLTELLGFYLDFDPSLWNLIKTTDKKYSFGIYPPPKRST
ncbi:MAG: hypothetical protein GH151_03060 [Bacteroidetes bacterium]|nr:hypothetical protein [Bacteroidota bacterium]